MKSALSAFALAAALAAGCCGAAQVAAAVDEAKKAGCEVSQSDGQNDMNKQISDVEDMVAKGVNLLILNPRDPRAWSPAPTPPPRPASRSW